MRTDTPTLLANASAVVRVDRSPMNTRIKVVQLACGHDLYVHPPKRAPRVGAKVPCEKCATRHTQGEADA